MNQRHMELPGVHISLPIRKLDESKLGISGEMKTRARALVTVIMHRAIEHICISRDNNYPADLLYIIWELSYGGRVSPTVRFDMSDV